MTRPKRKKEFKEWTFTIGEFKIWHSHVNCKCDVCKKVREYYKEDEELEQLLSKY